MPDPDPSAPVRAWYGLVILAGGAVCLALVGVVGATAITRTRATFDAGAAAQQPAAATAASQSAGTAALTLREGILMALVVIAFVVGFLFLYRKFTNALGPGTAGRR